MVRLISISAVALSMLAACGGGGGGDESGESNTQPPPTVPVTLSNVISESTFNWAAKADLAPNEYTLPVRNLYSIDLNKDGVDEVVFAGLETQPNDSANFTNSKVTIFGWDNGVFKDITTKLIPGGSGVEGVGVVVAGDFDNNGHVDIFASANADMEHYVHSYAFMNNGTTLTKVTFDKDHWEHGATAADINGDGYIDVLPAGYFVPVHYYLGGPNGLTKVTIDNTWQATNGSGVAVADFLGNGTVTMIGTDNAGRDGPKNDTVLYQIIKETDGKLRFDKLAVLPTPRLENPVYGLSGQELGDSHDVRAEAIDFNNDNLMDVLVFSRPWQQPGSTEWPTMSQIQFLQNTGNGNFVDVTENVLVGYDMHSGPTYAVVFRDLNNDGLVDIFTSEAGANSTSILIKQPNGTFVDTGRSTLSAIVHQPDEQGISTVARGPNGKNYLVYSRNDYGNGVGHVMLRELTVR